MHEVRYLTDNRDDERRYELVICLGGNGDWYVAVVPEGEGWMGRAVRICTSGGASSHCPGLPVAIADAYSSINKSHARVQIDVCPNCGGSLIGDGYTTIRHCENLENTDQLECLEPDAKVVYCGFKSKYQR